ncbi:hypothetical protein Bca4012_082176 [Brassica carinata]
MEDDGLGERFGVSESSQTSPATELMQIVFLPRLHSDLLFPCGAYQTPPASISPYVAPPPAGYPTNDTSHATMAPVETKSKGDGFWKGWRSNPMLAPSMTASNIPCLSEKKTLMRNMKLLLFFISISLLLIAVAEAQDDHEGHTHSGNPKCQCSHDHDQENKAGARKYKIAAVPAVLIAGVIGVLFPLLGKVFPSLRPETPFFFVTKAFAAGVILSTGFMHVLPEAYEMLNSPCLTSEAWEFPFTGFIAMVAAILTLSVDTFATSSFNKSHRNASKTIPDGESGMLVVDSAKVQMLRTRVIAQGKFKCLSVTIMSTFFAITTPLGIVVGMEIANTYDESSPTALIVQGVLNAASAGILIYMSLVDLLAADFMHPKMQSNTGLQIMAHIALLLGAGFMSLLAKWA